MQSKSLCMGFVLLLLVEPFTSEPVFFQGGRRGGHRRGGGGGDFGRAATAVLGTAAVVGGAIALKSLFFTGKRRRSVDDLDDVTSRYDEALSYFDLAMELDEDTCVEKTLCEIMASSEAEKDPSEIVKVLDTIYSGKLPLMGQPGHEDATSLLMAGYLGKINKSKDFCDNTFKLCDKDTANRQKYLKQEYEMAKKL